MRPRHRSGVKYSFCSQVRKIDRLECAGVILLLGNCDCEFEILKLIRNLKFPNVSQTNPSTKISRTADVWDIWWRQRSWSEAHHRVSTGQQLFLFRLFVKCGISQFTSGIKELRIYQVVFTDPWSVKVSRIRNCQMSIALLQGRDSFWERFFDLEFSSHLCSQLSFCSEISENVADDKDQLFEGAIKQRIWKSDSQSWSAFVCSQKYIQKSFRWLVGTTKSKDAGKIPWSGILNIKMDANKTLEI
jgi:hypothetical protein